MTFMTKQIDYRRIGCATVSCNLLIHKAPLPILKPEVVERYETTNHKDETKANHDEDCVS